MATSVITKAGLLKAALAGVSGPKIEIVKVRIGSAIITSTLNSDMTDVTNFVWEGGPEYIRYQVMSDTTVLWKITLPESVGDFDIGNIALVMSDGTAFTITALPKVSFKQANNLPDVVGNRRVFNIPVVLSGIAEIVNLELLIADEANVPTVNTEQDLPDPLVAPFSVYSVMYHTEFGCPVLAVRVDSNWWYIPTQLNYGSGTTFDPNQFTEIDTPGIGDAVRLNTTTGLIEKADGFDSDNGFLGFRGVNNSVIMEGLYKDPNSMPANPSFVVGQKYYADGEPHRGKLTTTPTAWYVGIATDPNTLMLKKQHLNPATTSYRGFVKLATLEEAQAGNTDAVITTEILSKVSGNRPNEFSNGQFYSITSNIPDDFVVQSYGTSKLALSVVNHSRTTWVEGPKNYLRFVHTTLDTSSSSAYSQFYQIVPGASKFSGASKTISFRARSQVSGQQVYIGATINFGTGGSPASPLNIPASTLILSTEFETYSITMKIPDITSFAYGTNFDDNIKYFLGIPCGNANYVDIDWIKLEYGTSSSPITRDTAEATYQDKRGYIYKPWTFIDNVKFKDGITTEGDSSFAGTSTFENITVNKTATFSGNINTTGNVSISGTLYVGKAITSPTIAEITARKALYS